MEIIGSFHITQVSLIITQEKNKIAYHSINWVQKLKYRRRVINKQRARASGMYDVPNSSYSAKGMTENYCVKYGDAMLEHVWGTPTWQLETNGNIWSLLWLSQNVYSPVKLGKHSHKHFSQYIGYSELENIRRIDVFVRVTCYPETMPMSRIEKKSFSIFTLKRSTELKTGQ